MRTEMLNVGLLLFVLSLFTACSHVSSGGGTIGTGLPGDFRSDATAKAGSDAGAGNVGDVARGESSSYAAPAVKPVISGALIDHTGKPISGAEIEIESGGRALRVRTDAEGRFTTVQVFRADEDLTITLSGGRGKHFVKSNLLRATFILVLMPDGTLTLLSDRYK